MDKGTKAALLVFVILVFALALQKQGVFVFGPAAITGFEVYSACSGMCQFTCPSQYESCSIYRSTNYGPSCPGDAVVYVMNCTTGQECKWIPGVQYAYNCKGFGYNPKLQDFDPTSVVQSLFSGLWDVIRGLLGWGPAQTTTTTTTVLSTSTTTSVIASSSTTTTSIASTDCFVVCGLDSACCTRYWSCTYSTSPYFYGCRGTIY